MADADHSDDAVGLTASELRDDRGVPTNVSTLELSGRSRAGFPSRLSTPRRCLGVFTDCSALLNRKGLHCLSRQALLSLFIFRFQVELNYK